MRAKKSKAVKNTRKKASSVKAKKVTKKPVTVKKTVKAKKPMASNKKTVTKTKRTVKKSPVKKAVKKTAVKTGKTVTTQKTMARKAPSQAQKAPLVKVSGLTNKITKGTMDTISEIKAPKKAKSTSSKKKPSTKELLSSMIAVSGDKPIGTGLFGIAPYQLKAGEAYMNERQRAHFKNILQTWRRELMEEVDRTVHHMKDEAANFPDPNDRATQEEEFNLELRTRDRERKLIKKIEEALQSIEDNEYGYCEMCGVDIGVRRLEARPTATLCIDCKMMDEIREKQGAA